MKRLIYLLAATAILSGCSKDTDKVCERIASELRAKGQDSLLYGIWYNVDDQAKIQREGIDAVKMRQYARGGHFDVNYRRYLDGRGRIVWYTEGDTLHRGTCHAGRFVKYASVHYLVRGDTLWMRILSKPIDPRNPGDHFYLRLSE